MSTRRELFPLVAESAGFSAAADAKTDLDRVLIHGQLRKSLGNPDVLFTAHENLEHLTWLRVYEDQDLYAWMLCKSRRTRKRGGNLRCLPNRFANDSRS